MYSEWSIGIIDAPSTVDGLPDLGLASGSRPCQIGNMHDARFALLPCIGYCIQSRTNRVFACASKMKTVSPIACQILRNLVPSFPNHNVHDRPSLALSMAKVYSQGSSRSGDGIVEILYQYDQSCGWNGLEK